MVAPCLTFASMSTTYTMYLEQGSKSGMRFLFAARRLKSSRTANYHVWHEENESLWTKSKYFGKLRSRLKSLR